MSRRIRSLSIGIALVAAGACSDAKFAEENSSDFESAEQGLTGTYRLKAVHSGKCVTVAGSSTSDGANVEQRTCGTGLNQQWTLFDCGNGVHVLRAKHSNKSMKVYGGSTADGANVEQRGTYDCSATLGSVKFKFINRGGTPTQYQLQAQHSGKCVDVAGGTSATGDGVNIHQWTCHDGTNQRFTLEPITSLPSGWSSRDIGAVAASGSANYSNGVYTVKGSGADIWGYADEFRFVYRQLTGDGTITARVAGVQNTNGWAKAGVMFRESLSAGSKHAFVALTPANGLSFQRRTVTGGSSTNSSGGSVTAPYWVRLKRSGGTMTAYKSADGSSWSTVASISLSMASTAYVGLAVTSHVDGTLNTSTFSNVSVAASSSTPTTWRKANLTWFTSYPDPGSEECIKYNGCQWAGYFACCDDKKSEDWVRSHNILAVHEKDWNTYKLKTLRLRQGDRQIDAVVYDMCSDSDCDGCCTANANANGIGFLIDIESYTKARFGSGDGIVEWQCLDC